MRVAVVASGSMGDVRPYAMLAGAFAEAGWDAGLVTNDGYAGLAQTFGLGWFAPALPTLERVKAWQRRQNAQQASLFDSDLWDDWFAHYPALLQSLAGAHVIVSRIPWIADMARMLDIPFVMAANLPLDGVRADLPRVRTAAAIRPMVARRRLLAGVPGAVSALNLLSHAGGVAEHVALLWRERRNLGALYGLQGRHRTTLAALADDPARQRLASPVPPLVSAVALSPAILPARSNERFTGIWRRPEPAYQPTPALARLLGAGPPIVYVGFGSVPCMPDGSDFSALSAVVAEAVHQAGVRVIITGGWGGLNWPGPPDDARAIVVGDVPHDWLFPRVDAIVHHCGVGTTMAALAAGRPSVPVPFLQDEPFWAWRLQELGVAPPPLDPTRITAAALATALRRAVRDPTMQARAAALGDAIRAEDGLGAVVQLATQALKEAER